MSDFDASLARIYGFWIEYLEDWYIYIYIIHVKKNGPVPSFPHDLPSRNFSDKNNNIPLRRKKVERSSWHALQYISGKTPGGTFLIDESGPKPQTCLCKKDASLIRRISPIYYIKNNIWFVTNAWGSSLSDNSLILLRRSLINLSFSALSLANSFSKSKIWGV